MLETFHEALSLGRSFEVEGRFRRWDGEFRWFLFRGSPLLDGSGKVVEWYGTNIDLEDRKRAEDALRDSEQSFRLILGGIPCLVAILTAAGEIDLVNRQVLEHFGKTTEQLKERSISDAVHPDDLPGVISVWRRSVETVGGAHNVSLVFPARRGTIDLDLMGERNEYKFDSANGNVRRLSAGQRRAAVRRTWHQAPGTA